MTPKQHWIIGSAVDCDVVIKDRGIAPQHCRLLRTPRGFIIEDLRSEAGTFVNGRRVRFRARVTPADRITLGPAVPMPWPSATPVSAADSGVLRIGRAADNDMVLDYPVVSPYHARVVLASGKAWIEDLNSDHGTALGNPHRKVNRAPLTPTDLVYLGWLPVPARRILQQYERSESKPRPAPVVAPAPSPGEVTIRARGVAVDAGRRRLLQDVSLTVFPGELVGIMGPSGAGKTTLLRTLNGYTPPVAGEVLYNGKDLYAHYHQLSGRLGYVPQDDILHHELTVRQVLAYGARLRLPSTCRSGVLNERLAEVVRQLGLKGTEDVCIGAPGQRGISGGQRKRVNLALELLTDPLVLFLDEPTSGLSSEEALSVMRLLRELADSGKTVVLTLHQPSREAFRLLDNLVLLSRDANSVQPGRVVYYGPAYPDAIRFFTGRPRVETESVPNPNAMLRGLTTRKTEEWIRKYTGSDYQREYVLERGKRQPLPPLPAVSGKVPGALTQWWTLVRRSLAIKRRSTLNTAVLLIQAPLIAALIILVYGKQASAAVHENNWVDVATSVAVALFLQLLAALWFGCSNAVREIVSEWAVYQRERMVGLNLGSYLAAKLTVLGGLCVVQCAVLLGIVHWGCALQAPWPPLFGFLILCALTGVGLGLLISAVARNSSAAVSLLPVMMLLMVILGGALQPVHRMTEAARIICAAVPSRWAYEGMLLIESAQQPHFQPSPATIPPYAGFPKERLREQDMAEYYFPQAQRSSSTLSRCVLAAMLGIELLALVVVLRLRDVH
ncbi:MAG TPA: ATP-binding cassette domain-containing protein [Gemmataceae bacterium]|jgi:ABC-type multidrug transport system ATPase subunit